MWNSKESDNGAFSGTALSVRCYESHPGVVLGKGMFYGGSASHPVVKEADVYVSLQVGSTSGLSSDPWEPKGHVVEVHYGISDMHAPSNVPRFKKMVTWLCNQLHKGKTVHVGCIGGHGRTGTVLSAIVAEMLHEKDAIKWVRTHYCKKAVESDAQIQFLVKQYGVTPIAPAKVPHRGEDHPPSRMAGFFSAPKRTPPAPQQGTAKRRVLPEGVTSSTKSYGPMASVRSLWKAKR